MIPRKLPTLFALATLALCAVGCIATPTEPLSDPWAPRPQPTATPDCPGGICPVPGSTGSQVGGIEVTSDARYPVDPLALVETKSGPPAGPCGPGCECGDKCECGPGCECSGEKNGPCLPCLLRQPQATPQAKPKPKPTEAAAEEIKTGAFKCERCQQPTVGREWREIWADDGTSLLCLCRKCFTATTPTEREAILRSYAARSSIDLRKNPAVEQAIREASAGY